MANIGASQIIPIAIAIFLLIAVIKTARIVPQRESYVIERLGKYSKTLGAGFHFLIPFVDKVAYKHSLKEIAMDVPPQNCITKDNITIEVDGVLYMQVLDPKKASTLRSEIGKLELDRTFEERDTINSNLIEALDKASDPWGIKITRYEIANISPPQSVKEALEKQMRAERERRAVVAHSEGEREAQINIAEGYKQDVIKRSEAEKSKQINEAEGKAREIELLAEATADSIRQVALSINEPGGSDAVNLRIAEQYVTEFGKLAKEGNTMILPANLADIGGTVAGLTKVLESVKK